MFDFCLTFPYAAMLALGGIAAWLGPHHSLHSLIAGAVSSAILFACAQASLKSFEAGALNKNATRASLAVAATVAAGMGKRYLDTGRAYPGLVVAAPSAVMALFYVWCLVAGPAPAPKVRKSGRATQAKKRA